MQRVDGAVLRGRHVPRQPAIRRDGVDVVSDFPPDELAERRRARRDAYRLNRLGFISAKEAIKMMETLRRPPWVDELLRHLDDDDLWAPSWRERVSLWWRRFRARRRNLSHLKLSRSRGKVLDMHARCYGVCRTGFLEHIPFIGDRWLRRRVEAAIQGRLGPGVDDVRMSVGYEETPR